MFQVSRAVHSRAEGSIDFEIIKFGKHIGTWYFQPMWGNTYNVHLDLERGDLTREWVVHSFHVALELLKSAVPVTHIAAWWPHENTGIRRAAIEAGFEAMGELPDLTFYTLEI